MTNYNDLCDEDRVYFLKEIADLPEVTINAIMEGNNCVICHMVYYNCLCSHDDD